MDYWVWVGKNGVTNYADQRPQGVTSAKHIISAVPFGKRIPGPADTDTSTVTKQGAPGAEGDVNPDTAISGQRAAIIAKITETKRKNCEIGKNNLARLVSYQHIRVQEADGKVRQLTSQQQQAKIKQASDIVRQNCGG